MFRKNYLISFLTVALFLIGSGAALAQTAGIRGRVELKAADGTVTPVAGALVEVFRVDMKTKLPTATTDKKGIFVFASLPLGANFVLAISGPNIKPLLQGGIKAGNENILIPAEPGDGSRFTEEEVRNALATGAAAQQGELSAEQKKQKEEYDKKIAELTAKNEKIKNQTAAVQKALDEGNNAFNSKNYDVAVVKYEEGYQANPDFVGSAPVLLNNKGAALKQRAVDNFNASNKISDANARNAAMGKVQQDLADAADAYNKSWELLKNAPAAEIKDPKTHELNKMQALNGARDAFRIMAATKLVDTTKAEIAKTLIAEYMALESDQAKKVEAQRILGDIYLGAGELDSAVTEYKKVLDINANDPDALAGIGLSLVSLGAITKESGDAAKSKEQYQEAINYLQRFVDSAPANHKFLADAKSTIEELKKEQNVAPQKGKTTTTTTKKKN